MALANVFKSSGRAHDDDHEQIHSNASTPPAGAATPHPDPVDKRLPGIASNYFGQVGEPFDSSLDPSASTSPSDAAQTGKSLGCTRASAADPPTPSSLSDLDEPSPMLPHERPEVLAPRHLNANQTSSAYPTPPTSSSSSFKKHHARDEIEADRATADRPATRQRSPGRKLSTLDSLPLKLRRFTSSSRSLSSITTAPTVHTSRISSPGHIISPSTSSTPALRPSAAIHAARTSSFSTNERLTKDSPRLQSTPPRTPRSLSHASGPSRTSSPSANPKRIAQSRKTSSALVGEHKGKLTIGISEGRGLKPSQQPYIVCQFQWNEYISKGPRGDNARKSEDNGLDISRAATPMRRVESDMGRPMAIPMRSRQSSHTSFATREQNGKDNKGVTDPVWNHEAVL